MGAKDIIKAVAGKAVSARQQQVANRNECVNCHEPVAGGAKINLHAKCRKPYNDKITRQAK